MNGRVLGGLCAIAALGLDQGTKALALTTPALESGVEVLPFLNLVRVLNDGVSFGMLGGFVPWWGLIALAGVIVAWLLIWLWRAPDRLTAAALEINVELAAGATMTARFRSDAPVAWNVHSHPGDTPMIHAEGSDAAGERSFAAEAAGVYSYLWVNKGSRAVELAVELRIDGAGRVHSTHP